MIEKSATTRDTSGLRRARHVPLKPIRLPSDGPAGEPEQPKRRDGGRYPLKEEFEAGRLGKYHDEGNVLWSTARWFERHHAIANRPQAAISHRIYHRTTVGELVELDDSDESGDIAGELKSSGYDSESDLLAALGGLDPSLITPSGQIPGTLLYAENRLLSVQTCKILRQRLDCNYRHLVSAVINRCELKEIGREEGMKSGDAAAGRAFVRSALRTASLVRTELAKSDAMLMAANDNMRISQAD